MILVNIFHFTRHIFNKMAPKRNETYWHQASRCVQIVLYRRHFYELVNPRRLSFNLLSLAQFKNSAGW